MEEKKAKRRFKDERDLPSGRPNQRARSFLSGLPHERRGQALGPTLAASLAHHQEAGVKMEQAECKPVLTWSAGITLNALYHKASPTEEEAY